MMKYVVILLIFIFLVSCTVSEDSNLGNVDNALLNNLTNDSETIIDKNNVLEELPSYELIEENDSEEFNESSNYVELNENEKTIEDGTLADLDIEVVGIGRKGDEVVFETVISNKADHQVGFTIVGYSFTSPSGGGGGGSGGGTEAHIEHVLEPGESYSETAEFMYSGFGTYTCKLDIYSYNSRDIYEGSIIIN